jgi:mono/diheme cytochrome c family protein
MSTRLRWSVPLVSVVLILGLGGCGTSINEALYQTVSAAGRTTLDIFLTEFANALAQAFTPTTPPADDGDDGADNGDGANGGDVTDGDGDGDGGDVSPDELTPDPVAGGAIFADNGCGACHCDDASGGCAAGAPGMVGLSYDALFDTVGGGTMHFGKPSLTTQQLVDLEAYLASP